jgi:hypothetical protein
MTKAQVDRLLDILDRAVKVAEKWAEAEYPIPNESDEAEVYRVGEKPEPQSREEYNQLPQEGRFERQFKSGQT